MSKRRIKKVSYPGYVKKITVSPTRLSIFSTPRLTSPVVIGALSAGRHYKSDSETYNYFKNLAKNFSRILNTPGNGILYQCEHPLWKDCLIFIKAN